MWLESALIICCAIASAVADKDIITEAKPSHEYVEIRSSVGQLRSVPVEAFVTSHKIPDNLAKPRDDESENTEERAKITKNVIQRIQKLNAKVQEIENIEQSLDPLYVDNGDETNTNSNSKRQTRIELKNFSNSGVIQEDGFKKLDTITINDDDSRVAEISGVQISNEYSTTMRSVLTTPYEYSRSSFDFIPVNIIQDDRKNSWTPFNNRNFDDVGDVSLVPAGSNSRIQVKKGPNGKDYEYEYVYYYYDEEDESKASASSNNDQGIRTTPSSRRGSASNNRSKYSSAERSTTVEPASNEIIPKNGNRGRQLTEGDDISEERLPTNTRFPPRSRSNHNTGTTEPTRARGNRPRPNLDLVDSSSFRTHQEGPEFPQTLPKGPVRFLGVTPNESSEEKTIRSHGRPHKNQEPRPVVEAVDDFAPPQRRKPTSESVVEVEFNHGKLGRITNESKIEYETTSLNSVREEKYGTDDKYNSESISETTTVEIIPTTEFSAAMDKVALDLYAFLQQGQSNLVDAATDSDVLGESTTQSDNEDSTTNLSIITTDDLSSATTDPVPSTTESTTTTTTTTTKTTTTTTTTTTTEAPTTIIQPLIGRGKFRRPTVPGASGSRNRFKSNGFSTTTTEVPASETTQRSRTRYGGSSNGGFKRPRPSIKSSNQEEEIQKENSSAVNVERPTNGRNRFRHNNSIPTTSTPFTISSLNATNSGASRQTFSKININRRRGRPTTSAPPSGEGTNQSSEPPQAAELPQEVQTTTPKLALRPRLPGVGGRPIRPGARVNIRRPGQSTTTTPQPEAVSEEITPEEPAGEGTEEETHEAPVETSLVGRLTTINPLNRLRSRNRLQVQLKTTTRAPISTTQRRSPLLPRRRTTEAPPTEISHDELSATENSESFAEVDVTDVTLFETSTAASTKHEETRSLSSLLSSRRRLSPRRPGQLLNRE